MKAIKKLKYAVNREIGRIKGNKKQEVNKQN